MIKIIVLVTLLFVFDVVYNAELECTGPNEVYTEAKKTCPPETCISIISLYDCKDSPPPKPGCACKPNYYRLNMTSPCIHMCDCPPQLQHPDCVV